MTASPSKMSRYTNPSVQHSNYLHKHSLYDCALKTYSLTFYIPVSAASDIPRSQISC